jgi:predicted transposase YbfD/YdcC
MPDEPSAGLNAHFADLPDPRMARTRRHELLDILVIAICAVICGADSWTDIETFGEAKREWLAHWLALPNGIPSHDTFGRVFGLLDPLAFERCFLNWIQAVSPRLPGEVVAVDGKTLRRSHDRGRGHGAIGLVSAWATQAGLVLGQVKVDQKSNEITAIPALLEALALQGCIVTVDALGCQTAIAQRIVDQQADYVLAVKDNQEHLAQDVAALFDWATHHGFTGLQHDQFETLNKGHGRLEKRTCHTLSDPTCLAMLPQRGAWANLRTVARVRAERHLNGATSVETRYFISSLPGDTPHLARVVLHAVRHHWRIENQLHWVLDLAFREDESRVRVGQAAENFAVLRHIALNLLRQETATKKSIHAKRLLAGWDHAFLLKVLLSLSG